MPKPREFQGTNWEGRKAGAYKWYEIQDTVEYHELFEKPKIIYPVIAKESRFTFDREGFSQTIKLSSFRQIIYTYSVY